MIDRDFSTTVLQQRLPVCLTAVILCLTIQGLSDQARAESDLGSRFGSMFAKPANSPSSSPELGDVKNLGDAFKRPAPRSLKDLQIMQNHVRKLTKKVMPFTVGLEIGSSSGSGVIVTRDGYILTAAHVIGKPGRSVTIILPDGKRVKGKTLGVDDNTDAGIVKINNGNDWPHAVMASDAQVKTGHWCLALGHPDGYQQGRPPVVRLGRLVNVRQTSLHTDCTLVGGDSGGPLFDMQGRVIGIHSSIGKLTSINYHVPIREFTDHWKTLALIGQ